MRLLGDLFIASLALVLAIPCGAAVLALGAMLDPATSETLSRLGLVGLFSGLTDLASGIGPETLLFALAAIARALFVLLVVPPVLVAVLGAVLGWRAASWYGAGTGLLTASVPWLARGLSRSGASAETLALEGRITAVLFLTGAASGLVYWLIAGRHRGAPVLPPRDNGRA
ncbi:MULTISPECIES: hypothetical protein [unclassified Methylobacterium]|uniref:hypothetical protein n=1 Tax=unclassified Methylobacterium TaxID=2615210 RepID=UPI0006F1D41A|nr:MULTISPECIES: hypothetical protein [unclassified Methylobacterium]KQO65575.1 hypothetical protein ASF20_06640 [Methylobacterium sp. Leaf88]KQU21093.1 hypothetical protein ASG63_05605 [Methylobacterium sp. Leaf94]